MTPWLGQVLGSRLSSVGTNTELRRSLNKSEPSPWVAVVLVVIPWGYPPAGSSYTTGSRKDVLHLFSKFFTSLDKFSQYKLYTVKSTNSMSNRAVGHTMTIIAVLCKLVRFYLLVFSIIVYIMNKLGSQPLGRTGRPFPGGGTCWDPIAWIDGI